MFHTGSLFSEKRQACALARIASALVLSIAFCGLSHPYIYISLPCHERGGSFYRFAGTACDVAFLGKLRPDQDAAVFELLQHDCGVLCAPTAFGKTVTAVAAIARRKVNTLMLVHRTELLKQWQERLRLFLQTSNDIGVIGVA